MKLRSSSTLRVACLLALATMIALGAYASAAAQPLGPGEERVIAQNGFGEPSNSYAWSMGWFKGKLYVGTGRDVLCVENQTVNYFLPLTNKYTNTPLPNVHCPANPYAMHLRAQIWQYTPSTKVWKRVYRSPATARNPFETSRRSPATSPTAGCSPTPARTAARRCSPPASAPTSTCRRCCATTRRRLLRSYDGVHWQSLNLRSVVVHYPQGDTRAMGFRSLLEWRGPSVRDGDAGPDGRRRAVRSHAPVLQPRRAASRSARRTSTSSKRRCSTATCTSAAAAPHRATRCGRPAATAVPFIPVVTGGAGRGAIITSVVSMHVFRDALYVGASGWYHEKTLPLSEMIRINSDGPVDARGGDAAQARERAHGVPHERPRGRLRQPLQRPLLAHGHDRAAGCTSAPTAGPTWSKTGAATAGSRDVLAGASGYQLWGTCNGEDWYAITRNAFGTSEYDFGARTLQPEPGGGNLYIGSANHAQGTMIMDDRDPLLRLADPQPRRAPERDDRRHRPQGHAAVVEGLRRGDPLPGAGGAGSQPDGVAASRPRPSRAASSSKAPPPP